MEEYSTCLRLSYGKPWIECRNCTISSGAVAEKARSKCICSSKAVYENSVLRNTPTPVAVQLLCHMKSNRATAKGKTLKWQSYWKQNKKQKNILLKHLISNSILDHWEKWKPRVPNSKVQFMCLIAVDIHTNYKPFKPKQLSITMLLIIPNPNSYFGRD